MTETVARSPTVAHVGFDTDAPVDISIFLQDLRGGGAERAMLRLAKGFVAEGLRVEIVLAQDRVAYRDEIPDAVKLVVLNRARVAASVPALVRHLRQSRPRAVLSALTHVNIVAILAARLGARGAPVVVSERNHFSAKLAAASNATDRIAYRLAPRVYRMADRVVCVSQGVATDLLETTGLPASKVVAIENPSFDPATVQRAKEPATHPWFNEAPRSEPLIMAAGRLAPQKDFGALVAAFAQLRAARRARLVIFGEGDERAALEAQAAALGLTDADIAFPGFAKNPFAHMARADLFVLSSRWEGFPNVLVEAMACGAPVVATDCPSGPHEVLDGGAFGPLVPVGDVAALSEAMASVLDNPRPAEELQARAGVFSIEVAARRYLRELGLEDVAQKRARAL